MTEIVDLAVVGCGPAGLTCGIYAARRGLKTILFEKAACGGQMLYTQDIRNYPGFSRVSGSELAELMKQQAVGEGVDYRMGEVEELILDGESRKIVCGGQEYECRALVYAAGGDYRKLNAEGEEEYTGRGVSYCATCDGPLFRDKTVAVVGGGNSAAEEALYLADIARKVYVIHRRNTFRCEQRRVEDMREAGVEFILDAQVKKFNGGGLLEELLLETPDGEKTVCVDGCFVSIGTVPASKLAAQAKVKVDDSGFIRVDESQETNIPGVFAAGDVTGGVMQISTAVGEGATAALKAYEYIKNPYWTNG